MAKRIIENVVISHGDAECRKPVRSRTWWAGLVAELVLRISVQVVIVATSSRALVADQIAVVEAQ
jgi:hypothetical protein